MATTENAIEALTHDECVAPGGRSGDYRARDVVLLSRTLVVTRLRTTHGARDEQEADDLIAQALPKLDGRIISREFKRGLRPKPVPPPHVEYYYEIPGKWFREQQA
jgi:hypothetical protein